MKKTILTSICMLMFFVYSRAEVNALNQKESPSLSNLSKNISSFFSDVYSWGISIYTSAKDDAVASLDANPYG